MELRRYLGVIRGWLWLIVAGTLLAGVTSYVVSQNLPRVYQASTMLIIGSVTIAPSPDASNVTTAQLLAKTYSRLLTSRPILQGAIEKLKLEDPLSVGALASSVSVETVQNTQFVILRVQSRDPQLAAKLANTIAEELISQSPAAPQGRMGSVMTFVQTQMEELEAEISSLQDRIKKLRDKQSASAGNPSAATATASELADLENKLRSAQERYGPLLTVRTSTFANYVSVVEKAEVPGGPMGPNTTNNVLVAILAGLIVTVGVVFLIEYMDDTAKSPELISEAADVATLGIVGRLQHRTAPDALVTLRAPKSSLAESFKSLRTSIQFSSPDKPIGSLLVTSSDPGDGKSTTLSNLAVSFAQAGLKVIAVDTDLRRPTLHKMFGLNNDIGVTSLLSGQASEISSVIQPTDEPNLFLVASGPLPPNPSELLGSKRMQTVISNLQDMADLLLFDSPPVLVVTDAAILSTRVDGVVLVVDTGRTRMGSIRQSVDSVRNVGGSVLGVVLNKVRPGDGRYYYYHYYSYYDYSADTKQQVSNNGHSGLLKKLFNGKAAASAGRRNDKQS